jgi:hypothetical protein
VKAEEIAAVAAAVSAVAALVSLLVAAYFGWMQAHASDPKVVVTATTAFPTAGPAIGPPFYLVTVANRGMVTVTVTSVGFELAQNGETLVSMDSRDPSGTPSIPRRLEPGMATSVVFDLAELGRVQREKGISRPFASTATGDRYRGRKVRGDKLASWAR